MSNTIKRSLFFVFVFSFFNISPNYSTIVSSNNVLKTNVGNNKGASEQFKNQKQMARLENYLQKRAFSISDDTSKWLVFGVAGLGAAILLGIFASGTLAGFAGLAGVVCLVIWFIKQNG